MEIDKKEIRDSIHKEYDTQLLSTKQVAKILNISITTLGRWKKQGLYLEYKQNDSAKNAPVFYPLFTVVDYIVHDNTKVM